MAAIDEVMTVDEVAKYLKTTNKAIYSRVSREQIPYHKMGARSVRFVKKEVDAWLLSGSSATRLAS